MAWRGRLRQAEIELAGCVELIMAGLAVADMVKRQMS